ncbi:hypothetical protein Tco_0422959, partial [Tanacetum coccineum]
TKPSDIPRRRYPTSGNQQNGVEGLKNVALMVEFVARSGGDGMVVC